MRGWSMTPTRWRKLISCATTSELLSPELYFPVYSVLRQARARLTTRDYGRRSATNLCICLVWFVELRLCRQRCCFICGEIRGETQNWNDPCDTWLGVSTVMYPTTFRFRDSRRTNAHRLGLSNVCRTRVVLLALGSIHETTRGITPRVEGGRGYVDEALV